MNCPHSTLGSQTQHILLIFFCFFPNNKTQADINCQGQITAFLFGGCMVFPYRDSPSFTDQRYTNRLTPPFNFFCFLHNYFTYLRNKHVPLEVKLLHIKLLSWDCQTSLGWICIDFLPHLTVVKMFIFQLLCTFKKFDITDKAKYLAFISMHGFVIICKLVLSQISSDCLLSLLWFHSLCLKIWSK